MSKTQVQSKTQSHGAGSQDVRQKHNEKHEVTVQKTQK